MNIDPSLLPACIEANRQVLLQGLEVLASLSAEMYSKRVPLCFNSSPGGHVRHILDHYECLLDGLGAERVDYEGRVRDRQVEVDRELALVRIERVLLRLNPLALAEVALSVAVESGPGAAEKPSARSSLTRELEFLVSHTVHHYALIAVMLRHQGVRVPEDFGLAPSTLRYQQSVQVCAR